MQNELSNEHKCMAQLYSVICAIVQSEHTPRITVEATMQTLGKIFNDEDGPFMANDEICGMTVAMIDNINAIVRSRNQSTRLAEADDILSNINWN